MSKLQTSDYRIYNNIFKVNVNYINENKSKPPKRWFYGVS